MGWLHIINTVMYSLLTRLLKAAQAYPALLETWYDFLQLLLP